MSTHGINKLNILVSLSPGILVGPSGSTSIRFRPALICKTKHINIFLNAFEDVLKNFH